MGTGAAWCCSWRRVYLVLGTSSMVMIGCRCFFPFRPTGGPPRLLGRSVHQRARTYRYRYFQSISTRWFGGVPSSTANTAAAGSASSSNTHIQDRTVQDFLKKGNETWVTYLTDVEGDKAYLDRYVRTSRVLTFTDTPSTTTTTSTTPCAAAAERLPYDQCIDFTHPRAILVFGGDIWDKGGHDLYSIRQLIDLKRRYPDRVVFILGNRDVNKLRIVQEIGLHEPPPHHPGLTWLKGTGRVGDPDRNPPPESSVERLKWILGQTMGSPDAFANRKQELEGERANMNQETQKDVSTSSTNTSTTSVTDQDVVESYRRSCHPSGELGQFLSQAQFICRLGPLVFVHGSLPLIEEVVVEKHAQGLSVWDDLALFMPWMSQGETAQQHGVTNIDQWMRALNNFCHEKVEEWKVAIARIEAKGGVDDSEEPIWVRMAGYQHSYTDLVQYGMGMLPNRTKNPTVVYNTFTPEGMPHRFYPDSEEQAMVEATKEFFERAEVQVILAGHKPQGDLPSTIRVADSKWVVLADTSYSSETAWHHVENESTTTLFEKKSNLGRGSSTSFRGEVAISEVLIKLGLGGSLESLTYHGVLSDGTEYQTVNLVNHDGSSATIGQAAPEHLVPSQSDSPHQGRWWTKSIFSDGSHLFYAGDGFNIWNLLAKPAKKTTTTRSTR